jgi:DNA repair exonuclease SbcCD ATPase subunit
MITLILVMKLVNKNLDPQESPISVTKAAYEKMREQIRDLEITVDSLNNEVKARQETADANTFFTSEETENRREQLKAEIAALQKDLENHQNDTEELGREKEKLNELTAAIRNNQERIQSLREKINQFEQKKKEIVDNSFFFSRAEDENLKSWLVVCGKSENEILIIDSESGKTEIRTRNSFLNWAKSRPSEKEYFVFYVRPAAAKYYEQLLNSIRTAGHQTGFDVLGNDTVIRIVNHNGEML